MHVETVGSHLFELGIFIGDMKCKALGEVYRKDFCEYSSQVESRECYVETVSTFASKYGSLMPRPHPAHVRRRDLVSQIQILRPAEVRKPCNC